MPTPEIKSLLTGTPKREVLVYARVSGKEQKKTLKTQVESLEKDLKQMGVKRIRVFQEQVSGTKRLDERPALRELVEYAQAKGEGKTAIVVRDTQRISRDPWIVGRIYDPLRELDIPLVSFANGGLIASTDKTPQPSGDLLMPILVSIGGQEIQVGKERTKRGTAASAEKGIFAGTPLSLYPKDAVSPWAELARFVPLMAEGTLSGAEAARRLGKSTSWVRKSRDRLNTIRELGVLDEWLSIVDMIRQMEIKNGEGFGKGATKPMRAVRRMTGGYIDSPTKFPAPTMDDLNEYFTNWKLYQPKRTK
jgi:DNA invertase Pin-like site-specific DNA recombinase